MKSALLSDASGGKARAEPARPALDQRDLPFAQLDAAGDGALGRCQEVRGRTRVRVIGEAAAPAAEEAEACGL